MTNRKSILSIFTWLVTAVAFPTVLNYTNFILPAANNTSTQLLEDETSLLQAWPSRAFSFDSEEDPHLSYFIKAETGLPLGPVLSTKVMEGFLSIVSQFTLTMVPEQLVVEHWQASRKYVTARLRVQTRFTEKGFVNVLWDLYELTLENGPSGLWVDIMIDGELVALFALDIGEDSVTQR